MSSWRCDNSFFGSRVWSSCRFKHASPSGEHGQPNDQHDETAAHFIPSAHEVIGRKGRENEIEPSVKVVFGESDVGTDP